MVEELPVTKANDKPYMHGQTRCRLDEPEKYHLPDRFPSHGRFTMTAFLALATVGALTYSNSLDCAFQFDDIRGIVDNESIRDIRNFAGLSTWLTLVGRPLAYFSFALNYHFHHLDVFGYHFVNLIIHIITGWFIFLLSRLLMHLSRNKDERLHVASDTFIPLFASLLFIVHPIQTQSVTYITQRMASMSAMFYFMALYFHLKGRMLHSLDGMSIIVFASYWMAGFAGICAVWSKESALTFPLAMVLSEVLFVRTRNGRIPIRYLTVVVSVLLSLLFLAMMTMGLPGDPDAVGISRTDYLFTQLRVLRKYLQLMILPFGQNVDHDFTLSTAFWRPDEVGGLIIILGLLGLGACLVNKKKPLSFAIFFFFIALSVESSIVPLEDVSNEHRLYLPMFGFSLFVVGLLWDLFIMKGPVVIATAMTMVVVCYGVVAHFRNEVWKTPRTLWLDAMKKSPEKARPYKTLGDVFSQEGSIDESIAMYQKAIELCPQYVEAYYNAGNSYRMMGDYNKAIAMYEEAVERHPNHAKAYNNMGSSYNKLGELDMALGLFAKAVTIDPRYAEAHKNMGAVHLAKGENRQAIQCLRTAAAMGDASAQQWLGSNDLNW